MNFYLKIETFLKLWNIQSKTSKTIAVWLQNPNDQFSFKPVKKDMIAKEISNLKTGKAVHSNYIPTKILIDLEGLFDTFICNDYNKSLLDGTFPEDSKRRKITLKNIFTDP